MIKVSQKNRIADLVPPLSAIEWRFVFIKDETLRKNISLALQYILVLIGILDKEKAEKTSIASAFYKNMIVNYAVIAEGSLHYCLRKYIDSGIAVSSNVMPIIDKFKGCKVLYKISETEEVCGAIRHKQIEHLTHQTNFVHINRAALKARILTKDLYKRSEILRVQRNKIHLAGLREVDNSYTKTSVKKALNTTAKLVERTEKMLSKLNL